MKIATKIGVGILSAGFVLSLIGGTVCAVTYNKISDIFDNLGDPISYTEEITAKNIKNIELEICFSNVEIINGDEFKIVAEGIPEALKLKVSTDDDELKIKSESINININKLPINNENVGKYTIYIPDEKFDSVNIENLFGCLAIDSIKCDDFNIENLFGCLAIDSIKCDDFNIECAYSDITAKNINTQDLDIENTFGTVFINELECKKSNVSNAFGDLNVSNIKITDSGKFENSFGSMFAKFNSDDYDFNSDVFLGDTTVFKSSSNPNVNIDVSTDFGDTLFSN